MLRHSFTESLREKFNSGIFPVIPDIKCRSPKEGDLLRGRNPSEYAELLVSAGATVISVVTEADYFGGSVEMLSSIAKSVSAPVLRKDFIKDENQVMESLDIGASAILLIASMLEKDSLFRLYDKALSIGLEPFIETHNQSEIEAAKELNASLIGINNRNITELERDDGDVAKTEQLAELVKSNAFIVSESSIASKNDVLRAMKSGAHAALVGTALLQAENPAGMYADLSIKIEKLP